MRVLVIGSGAREHAIASRLAQEGADVYCVPGNAGTGAFAATIPGRSDDVASILNVVRREKIELVVVGPEGPLVAGVVDALAEVNVSAFGPTRAAARLEGSKVFAKEFMAARNIPTAPFRVFDDAESASTYVRSVGKPVVVKADGLAAGKGVVVAENTDEALGAIDRFMRQKELGDAGARVVIEDILVGEEVSYHVISDGTRYVSLVPAQDYKRALDGDRGPNTGGMGAFSPTPVMSPEVERKVLEKIIEPTLRGMSESGSPFRGVLFAGLMISGGEPYVLEYNVRFGDPECEVILRRLRDPLLPVLVAAAKGDLSAVRIVTSPSAAVCVVLASAGYPGKVVAGKVIKGLEDAEAMFGVQVFHAGTRRDSGVLVTDGGRVVAITAVGQTVTAAAERAYRAADRIDFEGKHIRRDIGASTRSAGGG